MKLRWKLLDSDVSSSNLVEPRHVMVYNKAPQGRNMENIAEVEGLYGRARRRIKRTPLSLAQFDGMCVRPLVSRFCGLTSMIPDFIVTYSLFTCLAESA